MNRNNNENQRNQGTNQQLETDLDKLTENLQQLNLQQRQLRRRLEQVENKIREIQREQRRRTGATEIRRDRHNDQINIGDYVNFLTRGRFRSRGRTITQISHLRFVSARDSSGRVIN